MINVLKGFRDFVLRGNVVELAVAVVMGAALTAVVTAFTKAFIAPLIVLITGGSGVGGSFTVNGVVFEYAVFITALITFVLTAIAVYFVIIVPIQKVGDRFKKATVEPTPAEAEEIALLKEIRDVLRSTR